MHYLLDTGLLIRHLRGQKTTVHLLRSLGGANRLCISAVTRLEVKAGAHPSEQASTQELSRFVNLDLDAATADKAGELIYKGRGNKPILVPDAIVAVTALVHNLTLVTFNARDFEGVASLRLHPSSS